MYIQSLRSVAVTDCPYLSLTHLSQCIMNFNYLQSLGQLILLQSTMYMRVHMCKLCVLGAVYIHLHQVSNHVFLNTVKTKSGYTSRYG